MQYVYVTARRDSKARHKKYKLYHVSPADSPIITKMIPRIPNNWAVKHGQEDGTVLRISFAPSIGKCLAAIPGLCAGKKLRVYALDYVPKGRKPSKSQVPDVGITQEYWVTEPIENPVYLGVIKITQEKPNNLDEMSEQLDLDDSPDWFPSDITESEFISRFYRKNPAKGKAIFKLYSGDKERGRKCQFGDKIGSIGDYGWRWVKREKDT